MLGSMTARTTVRPVRLAAARPLRVAGLVVLAAVALAGCGGGGASDGSPVATSTVDLPKSYKFSPAAITVAAGTTVTWTNDDNFTHSVHFLDGGLPSQPMVMSPGQTTTYTFTTPGTYHYQCSFHPQNMQGVVVVTGPGGSVAPPAGPSATP
jgi:plastocyanin